MEVGKGRLGDMSILGMKKQNGNFEKFEKE